MDDQSYLILKANVKTDRYQDKIRQVKDQVINAFNISSNPYLALSGGKDSIAMLAIVSDIANSINRDFKIWSHISDASFPDTKETVIKAAQIANRELIIDYSPVSAFDVLKRTLSVKQFGKKGYFFDSIKNIVKKYNFDLAFVGVRAHESVRRMKAFKAHGFLFDSNGIKISNPIALLTTEDVFSVAIEYNYPIHPIYYKKHPSGDFRNIRLGYLTAQDLLHKGTLSFIKYNYPEQYQQIIQVRPDLSCYV